MADDLGILRRLVGIGDTGELLDLALERLLVETLDVALGASFDRSLDVDLDEALADLLARLVADLPVGGNRGGDHRDSVARQQVGDEGDPADVAAPILLPKPHP